MVINAKNGNQLFVQLISSALEELGFSCKQTGVFRREKKHGFEEIRYSELEPGINAKIYTESYARKRIEPIDAIGEECFWQMEELFRPGKDHTVATLIFTACSVSEFQFDPANINKWVHYKDRYEEAATEEGLGVMADKFLNTIKQNVIPTLTGIITSRQLLLMKSRSTTLRLFICFPELVLCSRK